MPLTVTALASGSSGNALLVTCGADALLIDCGIPLRAIERLLQARAVDPAAIRAVLLTHEHGDHALSAAAFSRRYRVPIVCSAATRAALASDLAQATVEALPVGERAAIGSFDVVGFRVPHDAADPLGFRVHGAGATLALAVDLGSWNESIVAALADADLLVIEANHDRELLQASAYPWATRQRIFGSLGHLDNVQCGELLSRLYLRRKGQVWLAHLSQQTNSPKVALAGVRRVLQLAGIAGVELTALPRRAQPVPQGAVVWQSESVAEQQRLW
jgi:phosphoribosyl 1,2-cyclic phosphodiesterase